MGGIRWNCWTREVRHFYGFFTRPVKNSIDRLTPGQAVLLLTQMLSVESGVIEDRGNLVPIRWLENHLRAWPGTYGSTFN